MLEYSTCIVGNFYAILCTIYAVITVPVHLEVHRLDHHKLLQSAGHLDLLNLQVCCAVGIPRMAVMDAK